MKVVRLNKTKHAATAMTGYGASLEGGRWNDKRTFLVYCSSSLSLATLEVLVHTKRISKMLPRYSVYHVEVDDPVIHDLDLTRLRPNWRQDEAACVALGEDWIRTRRSVALRVPSAVSVGEFNLLLNPTHPDFATRVRWQPPEPAVFDERVFKPSKR